MNPVQQDWNLMVVAQRQQEAEEYRRAAVLVRPLRQRVALWLRGMADRLEGAETASLLREGSAV